MFFPYIIGISEQYALHVFPKLSKMLIFSNFRFKFPIQKKGSLMSLKYCYEINTNLNALNPPNIAPADIPTVKPIMNPIFIF